MAKLRIRPELLLPVMLVLLAVLAALLAIVPSQKPNTEPLADRSVYSNGATGYRAWYLASKKSGVPLLIWEKPFSNLDSISSPATMLMVDPYTVVNTHIIFGKRDAQLLLNWVARGNTLVLLDDFKRHGSGNIANMLAIQTQAAPSAPKKQDPANRTLSIPSHQARLSSYIQKPLMTRAPAAIQLAKNNIRQPEVLLTDQHRQPVILRLPYGKGHLILGTSSDLGTNHFLHQPDNDNYQFLLNLLVSEQKPIYINEFIHGYREIGDIFSYFQKKTPLGAIFAQFVLGFILLLWLSFVRWTPRPPESTHTQKEPSGSGLDTYIQSLSGIYYRTQSASLALAPLLKRIESTLHQRFRLSLEEQSRLGHLLGNVFADYSSKEHSPDSLMEIIQRAQTVVRRQERLSHRELLSLAKQLTLIEERLRHHGQRTHAFQR